MVKTKVTRGHGLLEKFLAKKRAQKANDLIPEPHRSGRILDVGFGMYPLFLLSTNFCEKFGIDKAYVASPYHAFSHHSLSLMRHNIDTEDQMPFSDEYFDIVTMLAVFEHIMPHRLLKVFQDVYRVLKKGGLLIITTPSAWTGFILRGMAMASLISAPEIAEHKGLYTTDSIFNTLQQGGFSSNSIRCGHFELSMNTWITAQK